MSYGKICLRSSRFCRCSPASYSRGPRSLVWDWSVYFFHIMVDYCTNKWLTCRLRIRKIRIGRLSSSTTSVSKLSSTTSVWATFSPTIFPILEAYNAKENGYLFPNLRSLTLDVSSPAGMERCRLFLSPHLENLFLDLGPQCSQLGSVLLDMATKTKLKTFELRSPNTLPANFAELLRPQDELERISILAPGSITAAMGGWLSTLAQLKSLELDLSKNGGPKVDITGFHGKENGHARSSTPMSAGSRDSGVFSGDDMDFIEDHKKRRVSVGNGRVAAVKRAPFRALEQLVLSGNAVPVSMFLDGFSCDLMHLDLSIEDPPLEDNWRRLANQICLSFAESLKSLRIKPIQNSKLVEMVKTSTRGTNSPPLRHLSLLPLHDLHSLTRLELDLSESVYFTTQDMEHLALACPNVEELRLLPFAKYPVTSGPPRLTLEALIPLIQGCQRLHSLTAVVNAKSGDLEVLMSSESSTFVLRNLHLGHSWIREHLQVAIIPRTHGTST
ncbi:hypothetical protein DL96DRAFT_88415 [Flagelloscypha sp. PMI_526]|nr:hypothetical protein DL96DRAFT_88415 [Flagelloscypha sp. PMI_526]